MVSWPTLASDLDGLAPLSSLLVERPAREIGGQLPTWQQLVILSERARLGRIRLYLDGARRWEAQSRHQKSHAVISAWFDSV